MAYISMLFSLLLQHVPYHIMEQQEATVAARKEERLSRILQYLEVHFREPLRLAELARQEGLTQAYLSHFIKEQLHITFQDYLAALRLEAAFSLLNSTSMSLTDISYECGFSDPKYFNHYFHKQFGVYPRQWPRHQTHPKLSKPQSSPNQLQYILPQEQSISIIKNLVDEECS